MMDIVSHNLLQRVTCSRLASLFLHTGSKLLVMLKLLDQPLVMVNTQLQHKQATMIKLLPLLVPQLMATRAKLIHQLMLQRQDSKLTVLLLLWHSKAMLSLLQHNLLMTSQRWRLNLVDMLVLLLVHLLLMEKPCHPSLSLVIHSMMHPSRCTLHLDNLIESSDIDSGVWKHVLILFISLL